MSTKNQFIIDVWERSGKDVIGASELKLIQQAIAEHFGGPAVSPASIARVLADHGARLGHPEVLQADMRWRQRGLFAPDDLTFGTLEAATALVEKIESFRQQFENDNSMLEYLRQSVLQIKRELELLAASEKARDKNLAEEVAQWLTVWLQNPQIFQEWLALRRTTAEFQQRFQS